jgi:hypothetical protein
MSRRLWFGVIACVPLAAVLLALALGPKLGKIDTLGYKRIKLGFRVPDRPAAALTRPARDRIDARFRAGLPVLTDRRTTAGAAVRSANNVDLHDRTIRRNVRSGALLRGMPG